jgi:hypothetical protein
MGPSKTKRRIEDETIGETMARRARETLVDPGTADAAAHEAFARSLRSILPLNLPTSSDVRNFGRAILNGQPGGAPARSKTLGGMAGDMAKSVAEDLALKGGVVVGGAQRVGETALGAAETLKFANRLFNPLDLVAPPDGKPAWAQLGNGAADLLYNTGNAIAHPVATARTINQQAAALALRLDPSTTPKAVTFGGEMRRKYDAGRAQGGLAVDVASLAGVAAPAKLAGKLDRLKAPSAPEKYMKQGFSPGAALYLAEPYKGMGHHSIFARRYTLPKYLGGGPVPERISESLYNVLKPEGITRGDFYELHYAADGKFHGAGLPREFAGESWSGKRLGLTKAPPGVQQWKGTPTPTKTKVGGAVGVVGGQTYDWRRP